MTPGGYTFAYDNNGNVTSGLGATVTWDPYNYPTAITVDGGTYSQFWYDANHSRWKQQSSYLGSSDATIYIGERMEKWLVDGYTAYRHYIDAGGSRIVYVRWSSGENETYYTSKDHLGSMDIVTDASGNPAVGGSFAAFGGRRATDWSDTYPTDDEYGLYYLTDPRGFTGHEHLDNLDLIHMNGRVYAPWLGKFLSPDPYITEPGNTQNYNRYSYVYNNPLSYTDPSGYEVNSMVWNDPTATIYTDTGVYSGGQGWAPGSLGWVVDQTHYTSYLNGIDNNGNSYTAFMGESTRYEYSFSASMPSWLGGTSNTFTNTGINTGGSQNIDTSGMARLDLGGLPQSQKPDKCVNYIQLAAGAASTIGGTLQATEGVISALVGAALIPVPGVDVAASPIFIGSGALNMGWGYASARDGIGMMQSAFDGVQRQTTFGEIGQYFAGDAGGKVGDALSIAGGGITLSKSAAQAINQVGTRAGRMAFLDSLSNAVGQIAGDLTPCH